MPSRKIVKAYEKKERHDKGAILKELEKSVVNQQKSKDWRCKICGSVNNGDLVSCEFCGVTKFFK